MSNIIEVENLSFAYMQEAILRDVNFKVAPGRFIGVVGPNGAGKTTLLNLLCGLLRAKTGSITLAGKKIELYSPRELAQKVAVVRQEFIPVFDFTVTEIVSMARTPYLGTFGFLGRADKQIIGEALESTETANFAARALGSLSGGERQRVFIARALAQDTDVLLLDEPTTFLDMKHQVGIYDLLKTAQLEKGKTIIAVTHDINLAVQYCDEILLIAADASYQFGCPEEVLSAGQINKVFDVNVFTGKIGRGQFFIPLGKLAKDGDRA